jgi:ATP-dependent helicase IRC3
MEAHAQGLRRVLYTLPTGAGKTTTFAEMTKMFVDREQKVLILAHRKELVVQAHTRIKDHLGLSRYEIGYEMASNHPERSVSVVVGSVQTVKNIARTEWFKPDVIICDEAHHAVADTYQSVFKACGVYDGRCFVIGCTATAKRTDKQSLYAVRPDGSAVTVQPKGGSPRDADPKHCVFEKHVFDYSLTECLEDGWLVPVVGHTVQTDTDLTKVKTTAGDFAQGELSKAVDNARRTNLAINAWKQVAIERPTIVFCASVEHAHHSAEMWRSAGFTAEAVDGETESFERERAIDAFKSGTVQVLCNCGIFTEGTDFPTCACVVHLRPTKSWPLYCQMSGRGCRVLTGVVNEEMSTEERHAAIAASAKPDCLILDLVDITRDQDLCTAPSMLDLPATLNLQGQSLTVAKNLLDEFEEVKERVIGECPVTFEELKVRLEEVRLLQNSRARTQIQWGTSGEGYRLRTTPPGYQARLTETGPDCFMLDVMHGQKVILSKQGKGGHEFRAYLDKAAKYASDAITEHREANMPSRGTLQRLTEKQVRCLRANGYTFTAIDAMAYEHAKGAIAKAMARWNSQQQEAA